MAVGCCDLNEAKNALFMMIKYNILQLFKPKMIKEFQFSALNDHCYALNNHIDEKF